MNIYEKLLNITNEIATVNKNLVVGEGKASYKATGEADVLKAVKELEFKYKIYSYPKSRQIIDTQVIESEKTYNGQTQKTTKIFMRIETIYRFVDIEKPEDFIEITTYGDGIDSQDKAPGKAMTYSDKYALIKAYKIISGDDPDQNPSEEQNWNSQKTKEQVENEKVSETQAKSIYALMVRKGLNVVKELKQNYGIENTADLTLAQCKSIAKVIKDLPDKE